MNFKGIVKGLHHVTATVNDAQEDYDFYTKLLGLRLVKETVNFDNEKVFHFYYGNEVGTPSTIFTTFPYKGQGVRKGKIGTGQVYRTSL
jgi:glyoxalase family protein